MIMKDTTREYIEKNTYINAVVCNLLRLGGSWSSVTLNSKGEEVRKYLFPGGTVLLEEVIFFRGRLLHPPSIPV